MGSFAEGFIAGSMLGDYSDEWQALAYRQKAKIKKLLEELENLSAELEIERKRVLVERRNRRDYMRWWAGRGDILRELVSEGRLTIDEWNEKAGRIDKDNNDKYLKMRDEADRKIEQEVEEELEKEMEEEDDDL